MLSTNVSIHGATNVTIDHVMPDNNNSITFTFTDDKGNFTDITVYDLNVAKTDALIKAIGNRESMRRTFIDKD